MAPPKGLKQLIKAHKPDKRIGKNTDKIAYIALLSFLQKTAQETRIVAQETNGGDGGRKMTKREVNKAGRRVIKRLNLRSSVQ